METWIEFKGVTKEYRTGGQTVKAVDHISFGIEKGEFVVVLGPSGAGKSTLLNLLGGMDYVTEGHILVGGNDVAEYSRKELVKYRAEDVGFIFQFYNLIPTLTAYENVALIREVAKDALAPEEVLEQVGLKMQQNQFPSQLSGGEQQRVSIARAVCKNPQLLLCDEPTGALDSETGVAVLELLQNMSREYGRTVVIVTHNALIAQAADKVIRMKNGRIKEVTVNLSPIAVREVEW